MSKHFLSCILSVILLTIFSGCGDSDERRHPLYQKGVREQHSGNGIEAAENFKKLLQRRPSAIYTHLKLATVYDELLNQPLLAILHYNLYLEAYPDAPDAEEVKSWLAQAEKRCYEDLKKRFDPTEPFPKIPEKAPIPEEAAAPEPEVKTPAVSVAAAAENSGNITDQAKTTPPEPATAETVSPDNSQVSASAEAQEIARLKKQLAQYHARHQMMQRELVRLRKKSSDAPPPAESPASVNSATQRTYKVLPGDTPGKIARKFYGKSSLHYLILRANPKLDARKLRPGMVLNIPELQQTKKPGE